jgi:hypothetical protein
VEEMRVQVKLFTLPLDLERANKFREAWRVHLTKMPVQESKVQQAPRAL